MGSLDQLAKQTFADETAGVTRGAISWEMPPELNLSEVRLDGMLLVHDQGSLLDLPPPWCHAFGHEQIVLEAKMPGDHIGVTSLERTLLRRQAWQVQRVEGKKPVWRGQVPLWMLAPRIPATLRAVRNVSLLAPGCHAVETGSFSLLWIAANELPLREDLIPFLVARSGRPLNDFARWVVTRRPTAWVIHMLQTVPMSQSLRDELARHVPRTDEPEIRANQRQIAKIFLEIDPELRKEVIEEEHRKGLEKGREQGLAEGLGLVYEGRLGRRLTDEERRTSSERLTRLGFPRCLDLGLDLAPEALAAWLAEPAAT